MAIVVSVTTESGSVYHFVPSSNNMGVAWSRESDHSIIGAAGTECGVLDHMPAIEYLTRMKLMPKDAESDFDLIWTSRVVEVKQTKF